jgi:hypothetical protein
MHGFAFSRCIRSWRTFSVVAYLKIYASICCGEPYDATPCIGMLGHIRDQFLHNAEQMNRFRRRHRDAVQIVFQSRIDRRVVSELPHKLAKRLPQAKVG